ncbi:urease accessory protein UreD [Enterococcus sp. LJL98]
MKKKYDGEYELVMSNRNGRTVSEVVYGTGQSKISSRIDLNEEEIPCHFLISMGGGFVEGEHYHGRIHMKENTRGIVSSQAPTYIYKCDNQRLTTQVTEIILEEAAILECLLDEVIPYKNAKFSQETWIDMKSSATLFYSDGLTSGWSPDELPFQYDSVRMDTKVRIDGQLIYLDQLYLEPKALEMKQLGVLEGYSNFASLLVLDQSIDQAFIEELREVIENQHPTVTFGISRLAVNGFVLRVLGNTSPELQQVIHDCVDFSRGKIMQAPKLALRKNLA